ncbi:multicopper oxidase domain-containing protein [Amycolatopsis cynarae]|uniref:Multicopper oxidase domain-containing protein n=1 Tax=Amycolatopsis cynarae TaxID=2995223 RepID=A0ABY7B167_9PSEU|nr:multicopper oxidase domain-containing protein [Amycolatopsis sp. HUAS 11-8]WAL65433.1 multicopper oxidase domain-containing protein [Amycolatopsis sp. HUAS 11-8]
MRSPQWSRTSKIFRYLTIGTALGVIASGVAGSVGTASAPVTVAPAGVIGDAVAGLRPLGTAFGQQSQDEADLGDGTFLAPWQLKNGVKEFHLTASAVNWTTEPGRVKQALAFNGHIPGPTIRVNEGDRIRIVVTNKTDQPTSVHWHGMELPNSMDGVPGLTQPDINPGQSFTYEYTAVSTGTHWYHSHMGGDQEGRGLYGALEVVPLAGEIPAAHDYTIMTGDGALGFVFNGKSYPATTNLRAKVGERVHIRLIGTGPEMFHAIHLHSGYFTVVAQDGRPLTVPQQMDTITLGIGQTYDLIWVPTTPGKWMIHCHVFSHSETMSGMTGMVTIANVDPPSVQLPSLPGVTGSGG